MINSIQEHLDTFITIYTEKLATAGIVDPTTVQTVISCLTLAAYDFLATVKQDKKSFSFKTRGKYGGK